MLPKHITKTKHYVPVKVCNLVSNIIMFHHTQMTIFVLMNITYNFVKIISSVITLNLSKNLLTSDELDNKYFLKTYIITMIYSILVN